jgi:hypothetical protein
MVEPGNGCMLDKLPTLYAISPFRRMLVGCLSGGSVSHAAMKDHD